MFKFIFFYISHFCTEFIDKRLKFQLLWEFERTFNLEIKLLEERWNSALEKLRDYFIKDNVDGNLGREQLSIELLEIISTYFRPKNTKKTSNTQSLLQIFEASYFLNVLFVSWVLIRSFFLRRGSCI